MNPGPRLIRECLGKSGLTQADLGRELGTTRGYIAHLLREDANPTVETLERVLRALGFDLVLTAKKARR